jgi:type III pantothenate kinase
VIASLGTAVTIDYVSYDQKTNQHTFEGGLILPGLHLTKNTLSNDTADLKNGEGVFQMPPISTANAIESGFILSVLGNIKYFFELASSQSKNIVIILSGGDAEIIHYYMNESFRKNVSIKKDLVLDGLFKIAN